MARHADDIDDNTPLAGTRIDVPARIGWLLRTSRMAAGIRLRDFGELAGAPVSPATLSRVETAGRRSGAVIAAYERALDLPYGHLRSPIDILARTFAYAPDDVEPFVPEPSLASFSAACDAVAGEPTGHDWLRFAEYHVASPFGLPETTMRPLVERLASEVGRAPGTAYQLRYEALSKLRCSPYDALVDDVIRSAVLTPGMQRAADLLSAVTEKPTPDLVVWCGELLSHESWQIARAGCLGIQNMRSVGGLSPRDWDPLVTPFVEACTASVGDSRREQILSGTLASCAAEFRAAVHERLEVELAAPRKAAAWTRSRRNAHFSHAARIAADISGNTAGESLLARLIFEVLYDFRATHAVTSGFLLVASPFANAVREHLCAAALDGPDEITRQGAAYAFANLMVPFDAADPDLWLASPDPAVRAAGLTICGFAGVPLAADILDELVADDEIGRDALFAAGMAGQPELLALASDHPDRAVREAAQWWQTNGGRVVD